MNPEVVRAGPGDVQVKREPLLSFRLTSPAPAKQGRRITSWDNAECGRGQNYARHKRHNPPNRAEGVEAIAACIKGYYNPLRRHSALGYLSPVQFERICRNLNPACQLSAQSGEG